MDNEDNGVRAKSAFWSENAKKKLLYDNSWVKKVEIELMKQWVKDCEEMNKIFWTRHKSKIKIWKK